MVLVFAEPVMKYLRQHLRQHEQLAPADPLSDSEALPVRSAACNVFSFAVSLAALYALSRLASGRQHAFVPRLPETALSLHREALRKSVRRSHAQKFRGVTGRVPVPWALVSGF